jgi:hypothetical protein
MSSGDKTDDGTENSSAAQPSAAEALNKEFRAFIHDIVNPLAIAQGMLDIFLRKERERGRPDEELKRLVQAQDAVNRTIAMIREKRSALIAESVPSAATSTQPTSHSGDSSSGDSK